MRAGCLVLFVSLALVAGRADALDCECGCQFCIAGNCQTCKLCQVAAVQKQAQQAVDDAPDAIAKTQDAVNGIQKAVDRHGRAMDQAGAVVDEVRAAEADPEGYIREAAINGARDYISARAEAVRARFCRLRVCVLAWRGVCLCAVAAIN
jgi:hypothetical protein